MPYRPLHVNMHILMCMLSSIRLQGASVQGVSLPGWVRVGVGRDPCCF
jgi:hypothetical protein